MADLKGNYFIKFDPRINAITGCQRATLILSTLEYWFHKKPDGFYKFIEPCSHYLYRQGDSWSEHLGCNRKSFATSFNKIGMRYASRTLFENSEDKFQGKMYASYYDRYTNQTFFFRNNEAANSFFSRLLLPPKNIETNAREISSQSSYSAPKLPFSNGKNCLSYIETKNTSKNDSHTETHTDPDRTEFIPRTTMQNEIIQKMIEIWNAIVEEGKRKIELTSRRVSFLKKALSDKFDQSIDKWEDFCKKISSSKFLMGDKTSFKATIDWALKFDSIQKITEGNYGIGDRISSYPQINNLESISHTCDDISQSSAVDEVKNFRLKCLNNLGNSAYHSWIKNIDIKKEGEGRIILVAPTKFHADYITNHYRFKFQTILSSLKNSIDSLAIRAAGETKEEILEIERVSHLEKLQYINMLPEIESIEEEIPIPDKINRSVETFEPTIQSCVMKILPREAKKIKFMDRGGNCHTIWKNLKSFLKLKKTSDIKESFLRYSYRSQNKLHEPPDKIMAKKAIQPLISADHSHKIIMFDDRMHLFYNRLKSLRKGIT